MFILLKKDQAFLNLSFDLLLYSVLTIFKTRVYPNWESNPGHKDVRTTII